MNPRKDGRPVRTRRFYTTKKRRIGLTRRTPAIDAWRAMLAGWTTDNLDTRRSVFDAL